ncbi:MAG: ABC transporter ATP-binding protein [Desulfarculaceae bacterium]|jgi:branched-chain amino acid transport system ATP-binding protein
MEELLRLEHVSKNFGKLAALSDVSFSVHRGEVMGLIGPNGAGKTTLFNVVTGFFKPSSGKVYFGGQDVTHRLPDRKAKMGLVRTFQIPRPFKELTVFDNVAMGTLFNSKKVKSLGVSTHRFVRQILDGVLLKDYERQLCGKLGYGNQKLLELGRAQGPAPELLLLDEPFAGLNNQEIQSLSEVLRHLTRQGLTLVIVEHKLRELMKLVDRVLVLYYGQKIADGTPDEISQNQQVLKAYLGKRWAGNHA